MTKEELDKLQNNPLYQAYSITGRDSDGRFTLDEITAHECEAAGYPPPVYKYPDGDDCGARPLGIHGTSAERLKPNPNARYDSRYPGGFTDEETDGIISDYLFGEDGGPEDDGNPTEFEIVHKQHYRGVMQVILKFWGDCRVFADIPPEREEAVRNADTLRTTKEGSNIILSYMDTGAVCRELKPEYILT